ncbi:hypothetical protein AB5I41_11170 [Sphingomonas sp. MMS24-JH45]
MEWWAPPRTHGAWGREGDGAVAADLPPPALLAAVGDIDEPWLQAASSTRASTCRASTARTAPWSATATSAIRCAWRSATTSRWWTSRPRSRAV